MHNERSDIPDNVYRLVSLDERDVEDLHRLLGKLRDRSLDSGAPDAEVPDGEEL